MLIFATINTKNITMKINLYILLLVGLVTFSNASCAGSDETNSTDNTTKAVETSDANTAEIAETESLDKPVAPVVGTPEGTTKVKMTTSMGEVTILLYDATPIHRDNFIKLVEEGFYEGLLFHRIIKDFMIQGGDPDSKGAAAGQALGGGGPGYTLEAEIIPGLIHKKGALSAARLGDQGNPEKRSSGSQFYIVTGKVTPMSQLKSMADQQNKQLEDQKVGAFLQDPANKSYTDKYSELQKLYQTNTPENQEKATKEFELLLAEIKPLALKGFVPAGYTAEQMEVYASVGGTPFLDNNYTVFGEVIEGLDIVDKMGVVKTAPGDRPVEDLKIISMKIIK